MECDIDHSLIEKSENKSNTTINHPHGWYQQVRGTGNSNKFQVIAMT